MEELSKLLETRAGEEESTISCLKEYITTIESANEDSKKQILKQSDENSELSVKLKTKSNSGNKIKRLSKENQTNITRLHESGVMSKVVEEEKERMISSWNEDIIGRKTSNGIFYCLIVKNDDRVVTEEAISIDNKAEIRINVDEVSNKNNKEIDAKSVDTI